MSELKGRSANEDFVKAFTADQTGVFIRWMCASLDSALESLLFRSHQTNAAEQRVFAKHAISYAGSANLTHPAPSTV